MTRQVGIGPVLALAMAPACLWAQGGPPMITDDPGTPGPGNWEINAAATGSHRASSTAGELPLLDLNYGVGDRLQLKYEVAWVTRVDAGRVPRSGMGNSLLGVKWRFFDAGADAWAVSTYPQVELRNPASHSSQRGLVSQGTGVLLPLELQRKLANTGVNIEVGRELHSRTENGWFGGLVIGQEITGRLEVMSELHAECGASLHRSTLSLNLGSRIAMQRWGVLLISVGRDLRNTWEERSRVFGYLGWQFTTAQPEVSE